MPCLNDPAGGLAQKLRDVGGKRAPHLEAKCSARRCATAALRPWPASCACTCRRETPPHPDRAHSRREQRRGLRALEQQRDLPVAHVDERVWQPRERALDALRNDPTARRGAISSHSSGPSHSAARSPLSRARHAAAGSVTPSASAAAIRTGSSPRSTQRQALGSERSHGVSAQRRALPCRAQVRH